MTLLSTRPRWTLSCLSLCLAALLAPGCDVAVEVGDDDAPDTEETTETAAGPTDADAPPDDTDGHNASDPLPTGDDPEEMTGGEMTDGESEGETEAGSTGGGGNGETEAGSTGGEGSGGIDEDDECLAFSPGGTCQWVQQVCEAFTAACYEGELAAVSFDCMELRGYCNDAGLNDEVCNAYEAECDGGFTNLDSCGEDAYFSVWQPEAISGMATCLGW